MLPVFALERIKRRESRVYSGDLWREQSSDFSLANLLQTAYNRWVYGAGAMTTAFLKLDAMWEWLRVDPGFQKLCKQKQP